MPSAERITRVACRGLIMETPNASPAERARGARQSPGGPIVEARDVHKRFGRTEVLRGIDLVVQPGQTVVLIGPSGSGKTTFLRCINHLEKIQSGRIYVGGHLIGYREHNGKLVEDSERNIAAQR